MRRFCGTARLSPETRQRFALRLAGAAFLRAAALAFTGFGLAAALRAGLARAAAFAGAAVLAGVRGRSGGR